VEKTIAHRFTKKKPGRLIGDRAYDSDPLDKQLRKQKVELIAPHKRNRKKPKTQDGRTLRKYRKRWKIERLFAWIQNFRRCLTRFEYRQENFLGFLRWACIVLLIKHF
jgi:transposase